MKAKLIFHQCIDYDDGALVEMVLWRVPSPVPLSVHGVKYSLFYGRPAFESWDALARVLTGKRMELLRFVRRNKVTSVRGLAKALNRDYSNVHADVQALASVGLVNASPGTLRADYDPIETSIVL